MSLLDFGVLVEHADQFDLEEGASEGQERYFVVKGSDESESVVKVGEEAAARVVLKDEERRELEEQNPWLL